MSQKQLISIVDDDPFVRQATSSLVRSHGYRAATFESAFDFLNFAERGDSACIVCDVQMEGMSGIDLYDALVAEGTDTPIVFITAFSEERVRERAGADVPILRKPYKADELIASLEEALSHDRLQ